MNKFFNLPRTAFNLRWVQYILFWGFSFFVLTRFFSYGGQVEQIDVIYTMLFHLSLWFAVCVNSYLLIPRLLAEQKHLLYASGIVVLVLISTWLNVLTFRYLADWLFPDFYFISYYEWTEIAQFIIAYVSITSLLQLSRSWFTQLEIRQKVDLLEKEKISNELKALRAQINPHFLFNSLNHIYALAVNQSPKTGESILQLSGLLRYAIQSMSKDKVPVEQEINYMTQFTDLYKSRVHNPERIIFEVNGQYEGLSIAPLLLIDFVENCFKHGSIKNPDDQIYIELIFENNWLKFQTRNTIADERELPSNNTETGLKNIQRRLNLLYSGRYKLNIDKQNEQFSVNLELELS